MTAQADNYDPAEIHKFDSLAARWWDPHSEFKPLHDINPLRLDFIRSHVDLEGARVLDVGCGGGLLSEGMAAQGAEVTGIDMAEDSLSVARLHLHESGHTIEYRQITAEDLAREAAGQFDVVTCLEMLEHVPEPASIVRACAQLVHPGGHVLFSTINRNPKAYLLAVLGAEYILRLLPRGTHDYRRFIRPSELDQWGRASDLRLIELRGMTYNPITRHYALGRDVDVNYLACYRHLGA